MLAGAALCAQNAVAAADAGRPDGAFPGPGLKQWKERSFEGHSRYSLVDEGGLQVLQGETDGAASVLYREESIDLNSTPWLNWSWKIDGIYDASLNEQTRDGDDFPARLYVVVRTGILPWQTLALNYVWSSSTPEGAVWRNPFTEKAGMIAVRSGADDAGRWVTQRRNVAEDFRQVFGKDVESLDGYAVMVDGDNSGASGRSWFGNIDFTAR